MFRYCLEYFSKSFLVNEIKQPSKLWVTGSNPVRITLRSESWRQHTDLKRLRLLNDTFRGLFYFFPMTTIAIKK